MIKAMTGDIQCQFKHITGGGEGREGRKIIRGVALKIRPEEAEGRLSFSDCLFLRRYYSLASVHWGLTLCQPLG